MKRILLLCALSAVALQPCPAQEAKVEPPSAPFIAKPPEFGSWTIQIIGTKAANQEGSSKEAVPNEKIHCVKTKEIKRDSFLSRDGKQREIWYFGKFALTKYEHSEKVGLEDAAGFSRQRGSKTGSLIHGAGFPGFGWLDLRYYKDVVKAGTRLCYHFQIPPEPNTAAAEGGNAGVPADTGIEAWIDVATKYPVAIKAEGVVYAYEFQPPPAGMLQLPPEYAEAVRRHEAHLKQLSVLEKGR